MTPLISDKAAGGWAEAMAFKAQIEAAEAERGKPQPQPTFTMKALIAFAVAVYIVGVATGVLV